ncbi:AAA family ATPase [Virgibacillus halodenitrificans]|jgi:MoxR-like ATPase|uniref:AAA family ATPase n=1 Tax=Virgibacillus halodenitrificans TaxID=1482 RepID=A0AAC9NIY6_VIRHA|nr:MoxR family ATPase [Virgibacillus halodenitrificans]APC47152.1 AAA family ATPase [Virgibacillus halodenitrificans]MBD1223578.1 MoxR family ATPase [Virgibacillus halodenitrificans]MCG1027969.1 MoxR family ATPase [Virgibacillus halodenitrificans]MCJ0931856.1 MoxR family ATPase [Virgibacillus halodenitrificans]MEC2159425.1 MoxR family ATPase [Virgibacillus halodenitrificans]
MMQELTVYNEKVGKIIDNINKVMSGKEEVATLSLVALLAEGHVLLEDVPGVGKTMLVKTIAKSLDCDFRRIQFTPDLLPSDVTGISIYNPKELEFEFRGGPILGNIILADEINRTSPKTQSSLLEGMEEKSVTVDGKTIPLKQPFFVMATQNPIEYEGTYPLPEAQLDRFILKLKMGYPSMAEELEMLQRTSKQHPLETIHAVMSRDELIELQQEVKEIYIDKSIQQYIINLATASRNNPLIYLGVSPRGSISLMKAAKAFAYINNRDYVLPDDIKFLAPYVLSHRIILHSEARYDGVTNEEVIHSIIKNTHIPIRKEFG